MDKVCLVERQEATKQLKQLRGKVLDIGLSLTAETVQPAGTQGLPGSICSVRGAFEQTLHSVPGSPWVPAGRDKRKS